MVWLNLLYINVPEKISRLRKYPMVTVAIPAYNEESTIAKTLYSVLKSNYPKEKLEVVVINDGSTDKTSDVVKKIMKRHDNIILLEQKNKGKAAALNHCLRKCKGEFFACVDADTTINRNALISIIRHFEKNQSLGAVVSQIKVLNQGNIYERIQRVEYFVAILIRKLMSFLGTLAQTPGALSVYRTQVVKKVGGFDEKSITEDFEMAMRLRYHHYGIKTDEKAVTFTHVPQTFMGYLKQRVRWYRGFIITHLKFRKMFFNKEYGMVGTFQLPINILGMLILVVSVSLILYHLARRIIETIIRVVVIDNYLKTYLLNFPSVKDIILSHNAKLMLPIYLGSLVGVYFIYCAHKNAKERFRDIFAVFCYIILYPYLTALHWFIAVSKELTRAKRQW